MTAITIALAKSLTARQVKLTTGGHTDRTRCHVQLADFWRSSADMCQNAATHLVCADSYSAGLTTGGLFYPATTETRVCADHEEQVRQAPGFRWSRALTRTRAAAGPNQETADLGVVFAELVPEMPIAFAAVLAARLHEAGYRVISPDSAPAGVSCR